MNRPTSLAIFAIVSLSVLSSLTASAAERHAAAPTSQPTARERFELGRRAQELRAEGRHVEAGELADRLLAWARADGSFEELHTVLDLQAGLFLDRQMHGPAAEALSELARHWAGRHGANRGMTLEWDWQARHHAAMARLDDAARRRCDAAPAAMYDPVTTADRRRAIIAEIEGLLGTDDWLTCSLKQNLAMRLEVEADPTVAGDLMLEPRWGDESPEAAADQAAVRLRADVVAARVRLYGFDDRGTRFLIERLYIKRLLVMVDQVREAALNDQVTLHRLRNRRPAAGLPTSDEFETVVEREGSERQKRWLIERAEGLRRALDLARKGDHAAAVAEQARIVDVCGTRWGSDHPVTLDSRLRLATLSARAGDFPAARDTAAAVRADLDRLAGERDPRTREAAEWARVYGLAADGDAERQAPFRALFDDLATVGLLRAAADGVAAAPVALRAADTAGRLLAPDDPVRASATMAYCWVLSVTGRKAEAARACVPAADTLAGRLGPGHPDAVAALRLAASLLEVTHDDEGFDRLWPRFVELELEGLHPDMPMPPRRQQRLTDGGARLEVARAAAGSGDHRAAVAAAAEAAALLEAARAPGHATASAARQAEAQAAAVLGDWPRAVRVARRDANLVAAAYGPGGGPAIAARLWAERLGRAAAADETTRAAHARAISLAGACAISDAALGADDGPGARPAATAAAGGGDAAKVREWAGLEALLLGADHPLTGLAFARLCRTELAAGRRPAGLAAAGKALAALARHQPADHPFRREFIDLVAAVVDDAVEYGITPELAEYRAWQALLTGEEPVEGVMGAQLGRFADAAALLPAMVLYAERTPLANGPWHAAALHALGQAQWAAGEPGRAAATFDRAARLVAALPPSDPLRLRVEQSAADVLVAGGRLAEARPHLEAVLHGVSRLRLDASGGHVVPLVTLAVADLTAGDAATAEARLQEALPWTGGFSGGRAVLLAAAYEAAGDALAANGRPALVPELARAAARLRAAAAGANEGASDGRAWRGGPQYLRTWSAVGGTAVSRPAGDDAGRAPVTRASSYLTAMATATQQMQEAGSSLRTTDLMLGLVRVGDGGEQKQLEWLARLRPMVDHLLAASAFLETGWSDAEAREAYGMVVTWKGVATAYQRDVRAAASADRGDEAAAARAALAEASARWAVAHRRHAAAPAGPDRDAARRAVEEGRDRWDAAWKLVRGPRGRHDLRRVTADDVALQLPADCALVDFVEYEVRVPKPGAAGAVEAMPALAAFVVRSGTSVRRVELAIGPEVADLVRAWRQGLGGTAASSAAGRTLRQYLWEPLEPLVGDAATIIVCPDGPIVALPFAALPGRAAGTFLIEERAFVTVPTPNLIGDLLRPPPRAADGAVVVGGVDFGPGGPWRPLSGTAGEATAVRAALAKAGAAEVTARDGPRATEAELRRLLPGSRYVHVATHGFFEPASDNGGGREEPPEASLPSLRAGLVLAGANAGGGRAPGTDDGLLTALEVADLDLFGVDLAVLSACETGLGDAAGGEGLLGLQRAFHVAGARTVIASHWPVPDGQTRELMTRFYQNLLAGRMTKGEALRAAQLDLIRIERVARQAAGAVRGLSFVGGTTDGAAAGEGSAFGWGAFVLSGDWK